MWSAILQIRNVPDDVHRGLKLRAALAGMSLSEFALAELVRSLQRPTREELAERIRRLQPSTSGMPPSAPSVRTGTHCDRPGRLSCAGVRYGHAEEPRIGERLATVTTLHMPELLALEVVSAVRRLARHRQIIIERAALTVRNVVDIRGSGTGTTFWRRGCSTCRVGCRRTTRYTWPWPKPSVRHC